MTWDFGIIFELYAQALLSSAAGSGRITFVLNDASAGLYTVCNAYYC